MKDETAKYSLLNGYATSLFFLQCAFMVVKDTSTYFINSKILFITTYKETDKLQNRCISLPRALVIVPCIPHVKCSKSNMSLWHASLVCRMYSLWYECALQNCMQQCLCTSDFEVLHAVNMHAHICIHTHV